jgi:transcription termination factor NusB
MFRTELFIKPSEDKITLNDSILTVGSCFADTIGQRLEDFKFQVLANPFGTVYNPVSIHDLLLMSAKTKSLSDTSFLQNNDLHANYHFHSTFSSLDKKEVDASIQSALSVAYKKLIQTNVVILTYGTAWVYRRKDTNEIVANCHKMAASLFTKSLLTHAEIVADFTKMKRAIQTLTPNIEFILTVSPVRHLKDTLELNSVSKSILRSACYEITQSHTDVAYFPAYEIMTDDLRDYRFYKSDMLHPTEEAEEYIWQKFSESYIDDYTRSFIKKWSEIKSALAHKAFLPRSQSHQTFLKNTLRKINELKDLVNVEKEKSLIQSQIID